MSLFKKIMVCFIGFSIIFVGCFSFDDGVKFSPTATPVKGAPTIIIDAGHGGFDGGAVVDNIAEKDINLKIANRLILLLKVFGYNVIATRTEDVSTESDSSLSIAARKRSDLKNRLEIIKTNPNAIFISIHLNKFSSPSAKGAQMFYSANNEKSKILAESLKSQVVSLLQKDNHRTVKQSSNQTYLLQHSPIPAVIAECGFMSNPDEFANLCDDKYQSKMAFALFCGILNYYSGT